MTANVCQRWDAACAPCLQQGYCRYEPIAGGLTPEDLDWFTAHGWNGHLPTLLGQTEVAYLCSRCRRVLTYGSQPDRVCQPCRDRRRSLFMAAGQIVGVLLMPAGSLMLLLANR